MTQFTIRTIGQWNSIESACQHVPRLNMGYTRTIIVPVYSFQSIGTNMQEPCIDTVTTDYDAEELKGFSRSMAELQWLLLILVILYFFIPTRDIDDTEPLVVTMVAYALFVLVFRYFNFQVLYGKPAAQPVPAGNHRMRHYPG